MSALSFRSLRPMRLLSVSIVPSESSGYRPIGCGRLSEFLALTKPRIMVLTVFTAFVGLRIAPGEVDAMQAAISMLFIAVGASAAGVLNMWYDADIDVLMRRTSTRPIPRGSIARNEALAFGLFLAVIAPDAQYIGDGDLQPYFTARIRGSRAAQGLERLLGAVVTFNAQRQMHPQRPAAALSATPVD